MKPNLCLAAYICAVFLSATAATQLCTPVSLIPGTATEIDLGEMAASGFIRISVPLAPGSSHPRRLSRVRSSCGCLQILDYPTELPAGQTRLLQLKLSFENPGTFKYHIWIEQPEHNPCQITLRGIWPDNVLADNTLTAAEISAVFLTRALSPLPLLPTATATEVHADLMGDRQLLLVDVREPEEFSRVHLAGTLNLPVSSLRATPLLKGRNVVLINQGQPSPRLVRVHRRLNQSGWPASVRLLDGGLWQFVREYGTDMVIGDVAGLNRLSAMTFHESRAVQGWLVLDATGAKNLLLDQLFPHRLDVRTEACRDFKTLLDAVGAPVRQLLVLDEGDTAALNDLQFPLPHNHFRITGGWRSYANFLRQQSAYLQPATMQSRASSACAGCP